MYYTLGFDEVIRNHIALTKQVDKNPISTLAELHCRYSRFLAGFQKKVPRPNNFGPAFISDESLVRMLTEAFSIDSQLNDRNQVHVIDSSQKLNHSEMEKSFQAYESLMKTDANLQTVFNLVIRSVFYAYSKSAGGGSTSSAIGVIWISPKKSWGLIDYHEMLLHELTHNLLFIDECTQKHYLNYDEISKKENYALSAVLKKSRPLDKVIHSIMVSTEILKHRDLVTGHNQVFALHPDSKTLLRQAISSIESVEAMPNLKQLVTPRTLHLLNRCRSELEVVRINLQNERYKNVQNA